jgi:hypothetical protein
MGSGQSALPPSAQLNSVRGFYCKDVDSDELITILARPRPTVDICIKIHVKSNRVWDRYGRRDRELRAQEFVHVSQPSWSRQSGKRIPWTRTVLSSPVPRIHLKPFFPHTWSVGQPHALVRTIDLVPDPKLVTALHLGLPFPSALVHLVTMYTGPFFLSLAELRDKMNVWVHEQEIVDTITWGWMDGEYAFSEWVADSMNLDFIGMQWRKIPSPL